MRNRFSALPLMLAMVAVLIVGCGRAPDIVGVDNAEFPAESLPDVTRHRIFITTTREASEVVGVFFSGERAPSLGLASVDVTIPPTHVVGQLERPKRLPPDPRTEFAIVDPTLYRTPQPFVTQINRELAKRPPGERTILLFVHGYNTSTSDAILRLAQFVEDTDYQGVPVLFTWASAAKLPRYVYDLNSALIARTKLKELAEVLAQTQARDVDILAHSMGTFLTMEGLVESQLTGRLGKRANIQTVMLASPDIDIDLFRTQIAVLPQWLRERMYLLVSKDDAALRVSSIIAGGVPRVGAEDAAEFEGLGVTVIDLSQVEDSTSGSHTKFVGSPEVVQLIGRGLNRSSRFNDNAGTALGGLLLGVPIQIIGE